MARKQSNYWVFTLNNPKTQLDPEKFKEKPKYMVWQLESGESGTEHLQGYVIFGSKKRLATVKAIIGVPEVHLENRKGSHEQAKTYCMEEEPAKGKVRVTLKCIKGSGPWEYGSDESYKGKVPGKRNDLLAMKALIDSGASEEAVWDAHYGAMLRYHRSVKTYKMVKRKYRRWEMDVIVLVGPTDVGKSWWCDKFFPAPDSFWVPHPGTQMWWDGYEGQQTVILDEFYGNWCKWSFLLKLLDRYPMQVPIHGTNVAFCSKRIVLTSNSHPKDWYKAIEDWSPLERRIRTLYDLFDRDDPTVLVQSLLPDVVSGLVSTERVNERVVFLREPQKDKKRSYRKPHVIEVDSMFDIGGEELMDISDGIPVHPQANGSLPVKKRREVKDPSKQCLSSCHEYCCIDHEIVQFYALDRSDLCWNGDLLFGNQMDERVLL